MLDPQSENSTSIQAERLASLIEFCHQSARLRGKPPATVATHRNFSLYENGLSGMPGVHLNLLGTEDESELWLSIDRLHETKPPEVTSPWLRPWIAVARRPSEEPTLIDSVSGSALIDAGTHVAEVGSDSEGSEVKPDELISLEGYSESVRVRSLFNDYVKSKWSPWAIEERKRLKTIRLYSELFTLKQQIEGGIVESQLEIVWGVGLGVWKTSTTTVSYPLIGRLVELSLNPITAALEVHPRDTDPRVELDWYAAQDNPGVADLEKATQKFYGDLSTTFSPFDRSTYEPLLRAAVTHLDANGVYWPSQVQPEDRAVPKAEEHLKVTDTWVLFARPRTNSSYLQDLERLKVAVEGSEGFPPAVTALVTDPDTENPEVELPTFRGISASYYGDSGGTGGSLASHKARDLYFPKPFNDEQVRIIQLLDIYDGVVAQGPPGTGKTHTIANVICHFLASGKRVLVTSMKDPALAVLQDQLPDDIQPLAISLLTSEQEGLKKFEHSILKIASEVQSLDRSATAKEIHHLDESIDTLHGQLARVDWDTSSWVKKNLSKILIDSVELDAKDAAHELVANDGQYEWITDSINIGPKFDPRFTDSDVSALRGARSELGVDIGYVESSLPQLIEFPDAKSILETHQDLSKFEQLSKEVESGGVPSLADATQQTIDAAVILHEHVDTLKRLRTELQAFDKEWLTVIKNHIVSGSKQDVLKLLQQLGEELAAAQGSRNGFLSRPVSLPDGIESNDEIFDAVVKLSQGNRPFGLSGLIGKSAQKKALDSIRILGDSPQGPDDWQHVAAYLSLFKQMRVLALRWNATAAELNLPQVDTTSSGGQQASALYLIVKKVEQEVELEQAVLAASKGLFTSWLEVDNVISIPATFAELSRALKHHLAKNRLFGVWSQKEHLQKVLDGRSGLVVDQIRGFLSQKLGNPLIDDSDMQVGWSDLMAELSRVLALRSKLDTVQRVTKLISESGAPHYASSLQRPVSGVADQLLPSNLRQSWRLRRLATYLDEIDAQEELKALSKRRQTLEVELARAYQDVVVKRTWLKLAENASPSIRASLQAYLGAIRKIGKGTGKRAARYRQDARNAASRANAAVPCWIMPHYRISESLPPELGCFDLVIIDEASQSDLTALPALLRARKVLIVGDDKQVSPEGIGLEEEKIRNLMSRFLGNQVDTYRSQMSPERSIYDLFKVVYAKSSVMLKEHFRCVAPIIEYSKREFYNHELRPLRLPKASERLDPPLIDVVLQDGYRDGYTNHAEARFIVEEIKKIVADERFYKRSIGVVALLADKQAYLIQEMLIENLGPELFQKHNIACGDARTFQGKERDIMFLSMVVAPNEPRITPLSRDTYAQRFNVAASRARDRMYLVRSVSLEHLSAADKLRRSLITHFSAPFAHDEPSVENARKLCESPFEEDVYDVLTERGYWVTPQVKVGQFRIDLVVEGSNDSRLAVECDGDKYHGPDKWADDSHRQHILERAGWTFWRCFASTWVRRKPAMIDELVQTLTEHGIEPVGSEFSRSSIHCEHRVVIASELVHFELPGSHTSDGGEPTTGTSITDKASQGDGGVDVDVSIQEAGPEFVEAEFQAISIQPAQHPDFDVPDTSEPSQDLPDQPSIAPGAPAETFTPAVIMRSGLKVRRYQEFNEAITGDPRQVNEEWIAKRLVEIVAVEGPVIAKRACNIYLRAVGVKRMGNEIRATMAKALRIAISRDEIEALNGASDADIMQEPLRQSGSPALVIRTRGDRLFEEITPGEIQFVARYTADKNGVAAGSEEHLRMVLEFFDLKRLTTQVGTSILEVMDRQLPHVDAALKILQSGKQV